MIAADNPSLRQALASDPAASTWVSANAGSGKTKVLIDRVARLLLAGVSPQGILCLTYTKAAAAEMQVRLFARLGGWAMLPDDDLRAALGSLGGGAAADLAQARRLFAQAIETPGGLRIQTIHSFCAGLLRRFPLEAGVSPGFRELEDRAAALMVDAVLDDLAERDPGGAMSRLAATFPGADLAKLATAVTGQRAGFAAVPDDAALSVRLGVSPGDSDDRLRRDALRHGDAELVAAVAEVMAGGSPNDTKAAWKLRTLDLSAPGLAPLEALEGVMLFGAKAKAPFGPKGRDIATKSTKEQLGDLAEGLDDLAQRIADARPRRLALQAFRKSQAIHHFARAFLPAYAQAKAARGALDFDDLILSARRLLSDPSVAPWVLWRLDGAIDHILVDEAQDTSPAQWDIIQSLAAEFTAGRGTRADAPRTLFVVGDRKQSIYSFQGADLRAFSEKQAHFRQGFADSGRGLQELDLPHSFRSSPAVLRLVDATFAAPGHILDPGLRHIAFRDTMPGRCDLWDPVEETPADRPPAWDDPVDTRGADHHDRVLARRIAWALRDLFDRGSQVPVADRPDTSRRLTPGDVMILVRRRSALFAEIIAALKAEALPVAGADRLKLGGELAVRDLLALLSVIDLPDDDLSLAALLRSPLMGWSEDDLFRLAHGRPASLWEALRARGPSPALAMLQDLMAQADYLRPHDLIDRALTRHDGRRRLVARLGAEAIDGIDALLAQSLAYETEGVPSLTGFLVWSRAEDAEVKRRLDSGGGTIRVMTIHGAKGLEAPLVILPDTAARRGHSLSGPSALPDGTPVWQVAAADRPPALAEAAEAARQADADEDMRLLYVAMTRAQSWLIVAAAGNLGKDPGETGNEDAAPVWYRTVEAGMIAAGARARADDTFRLSHGDWPPDLGAAAPDAIAPADALPGWAVTPAPDALHRPRSLAPTALGGAKVLHGEATDHDHPDDEAGKARGTALHRLLEHLPLWPRADWPRVAAALMPEADADDLLPEAVAVLNAPDLARLFAPGTLAEVPFAADWEGRRLSGTIDRLVVGRDHVLAVDYKSNRLIPDSAAGVPDGILRQMGAYAHALGRIYPGRRVEVAILWTRAARLMPLDAAAVNAALMRASTP
ncbi:MAG: double-strand break repair helicase AddA [Paracoccaceae bacterium]|nr:MAG: double-strand break repair helicase AddA [Paracoccaceae bacterium]